MNYIDYLIQCVKDKDIKCYSFTNETETVYKFMTEVKPVYVHSKKIGKTLDVETTPVESMKKLYTVGYSYHPVKPL